MEASRSRSSSPRRSVLSALSAVTPVRNLETASVSVSMTCAWRRYATRNSLNSALEPMRSAGNGACPFVAACWCASIRRPPSSEPPAARVTSAEVSSQRAEDHPQRFKMRNRSPELAASRKRLPHDNLSARPASNSTTRRVSRPVEN